MKEFFYELPFRMFDREFSVRYREGVLTFAYGKLFVDIARGVFHAEW